MHPVWTKSHAVFEIIARTSTDRQTWLDQFSISSIVPYFHETHLGHINDTNLWNYKAEGIDRYCHESAQIMLDWILDQFSNSSNEILISMRHIPSVSMIHTLWNYKAEGIDRHCFENAQIMLDWIDDPNQLKGHFDESDFIVLTTNHSFFHTKIFDLAHEIDYDWEQDNFTEKDE